MAVISKPFSRLFSAVAVLALVAVAGGAALSKEDIKLLQDAGGWEYVKVSDQDAGIQTEHVCFDGQPHPGQCTGKLMLSPDKTFVQQVSIHGQSIDRHGTYEIEEEHIAFYDEFGTRDGPYDVQLNTDTKMLVLSMPQVRLELELESQYKEDLKEKKAPRH
jgi:hypothetical protein